MILLDTNALFFIHGKHRRARCLTKYLGKLYLSPIALLELQFLVESGRLRWDVDGQAHAMLSDPRWIVDDVSTQVLVDAALDLTWARDPFDRLIVAHALARKWKLATADSVIIEHLAPSRLLEL